MTGALRLIAALLLTTIVASGTAEAACVTPGGIAGDMTYDFTHNVMVYCNGTNWVNMGTSNAMSIGTLTAGNFCTTDGSVINCGTAYTGTGNVVLASSPTLSGTVGIGTTAINKLDIFGGIAVGTSYAGINTAPTNGLIVQGNVGIGSTNPGSKLVVAGDSSNVYGAQMFIAGTTNPNYNLYLGYNTTGNYGSIQSVQSGTAFTTLAVNPSGGNIGIGTATVANKLDVNGSASIGYVNTAAPSNGLLVNGNVAIGTTAPNTKLTVNGDVAYQLGTDWTTTGSQNDVALGAYSAIRFNGTAAATFTGIAGGQAGKILFIHNASAYALTLSNANVSSAAANRILTGTGSDLVLAAGSSIQMQYDPIALNWRIVGGTGSGGGGGGTSPSFSATLGGADQTSITSNTYVKLHLNTKSFDTNNNFIPYGTSGTCDTGGNGGCYKPTIAGKYLFTLTLQCGDGATGGCLSGIYKNGSAYSYGYISNPNTLYQIPVATAIIDMNGTTDYVEGYTLTAGTKITATNTHFDGSLLGGGGGSGSGTVTSSTAGQVAYFQSTGTTVIGTSTLNIANAKVGVGTSSPTNILSLAGTAAQTFWMERALSGGGNNLTVSAGGAQSGTTNSNGGNLVLSSGITTGTGSSSVVVQTYPAASGSGSTDNAATTALTVSATGVSGTNAATTVQGNAGSGTNANGGNVTIASGVSTGTGASSVSINVYGAGTSGTASNAPTAGLTVSTALAGGGYASTNFVHLAGQPVTGATNGSAGGSSGQIEFNNGGNFLGDANLIWDNTNKRIGIGAATPTYDLSFGGAAAREIWMERATAGAGNNFIHQAGGAQSGGTNLNGGNLVLASGISTGTGSSSIQFKTFPAGSSGTADATATTAMTITGAGNVGIGTTSPSNVLTVFGSGTGASPATSGTTDATINGRLCRSAVCVDIGMLDSGTGFIQNHNNGNFATNYNLSLQPNGGNVGIWTTSPGYPLTIATSVAKATTALTNVAGFGSSDASGVSDLALLIREGSNATGGSRYMDISSNENGCCGRALSLNATGGYVGIGNTGPSYILDVTGQARFTGGYTTSDQRWKTNVQPVKDALATVGKLRGVTFNWKRNEFPQMHFVEGMQIGFIAQEIEKVLPEIVSIDRDGYKNVSYESVIPVLTEAIKELKADNDNLRAANDAEATELKSNAAMIKALRADVDALKAARH